MPFLRNFISYCVESFHPSSQWFVCLRVDSSGSAWLERQFFSCQRSKEKEMTKEESHQLISVVRIDVLEMFVLELFV